MAFAGIDVIVQILNGVTYDPIATQKGASLKMSAESIDASSKDNNAWADSLPGQQSWSVECDGLLSLTDTTQAYLLTEFRARNPITVRVLMPDGKVFEGLATITDHSMEFGKDEASSFSLTLQGKGEPDYILETPA